MREPTVARNYAEVLVSLAQEAKDLEGFGAGMDMVADACAGDARLKQFLETPSVTAKQKASCRRSSCVSCRRCSRTAASIC